ncbi:unnamed protein product [Didymodactylos carnosus]|uniref:Uncharacterized protein n=1 Tax=Didymodactylos carnosus TaxID=1234261 RepID=A0A815P0V1_9BILA|nr:unnamed protein product [Didymodactylos carnosus]CAF4316042.1 unnamed protein product [Didymodactylos carnosus]
MNFTRLTICISINDKINLSTLLATFLSLNSTIENNTDEIQTVYFNISINAPFAELNRFLFGLFISGTLIDLSNGLTFSLIDSERWQFIIEVPYLEKLNKKVEENFDYLLPLLSIYPHSSEEVTAKNYELFIGDNEELVARFLKAFEGKSIDRALTINMVNGTETSVGFARLQDDIQCCFHTHRMLDHYAPEIRQNKTFELSFTKFLYPRIRFFTGPYYTLNQTISRENEEACNNRQMTTTDENTTEYVTEKLRKNLCRQIHNDKILREIVNELGEELIETYSQDLIRTFCTITEKSSNIDNELENNNKREKTIEFLSKWLQIIDNDYMTEYDKCLNKNIWLLSYIYTSFEYKKNDLMSLYTACRTLNNLNIQNNIPSQDFGRVQFHEYIFSSMFNCLCSNGHYLYCLATIVVNSRYC